jgi:6-phosphogluconolactonase/glucosamine-6-phosphate isomerase/deaminase
MTTLVRRIIGENIWFSDPQRPTELLKALVPKPLSYEVLPTEFAVGRAMFAELDHIARMKDGDIVIILLGGRGGQAFHRLFGQMALDSEADDLLARLHVFTQDALAPLPAENAFSFVRDFERLLGPAFFRKIKSFTSMRTDAPNLEQELVEYVKKLNAFGDVDLFFVGHGPEAAGASHIAYIRPGSGATGADLAGLIPVSTSIREHHIAKFKAGGTAPTPEDEEQCRNATHIMTLGPALLLNAKRIVQSIVDADTAPAKRVSFRRVVETDISSDVEMRARQLDENPGLWMRLHDNVCSLILPDVLACSN